MIKLLQRVVRGFKARQQVKRMLALQKKIRETVAAQRLQKIVRGCVISLCVRFVLSAAHPLL